MIAHDDLHLRGIVQTTYHGPTSARLRNRVNEKRKALLFRCTAAPELSQSTCNVTTLQMVILLCSSASSCSLLQQLPSPSLEIRCDTEKLLSDNVSIVDRGRKQPPLCRVFCQISSRHCSRHSGSCYESLDYALADKTANTQEREPVSKKKFFQIFLGPCRCRAASPEFALDTRYNDLLKFTSKPSSMIRRASLVTSDKSNHPHLRISARF